MNSKKAGTKLYRLLVYGENLFSLAGISPCSVPGGLVCQGDGLAVLIVEGDVVNVQVSLVGDTPAHQNQRCTVITSLITICIQQDVCLNMGINPVVLPLSKGEFCQVCPGILEQTAVRIGFLFC